MKGGPVISGVYFLQPEAGGPIKIGYSTNVEMRVRELQRMNAVPLRLLGTIGAPCDLERWLHDRFAEFRLHGEWFEPCAELLAFAAGEESNPFDSTVPLQEASKALGVPATSIDGLTYPCGPRGGARVLERDLAELARHLDNDRACWIATRLIRDFVDRLRDPSYVAAAIPSIPQLPAQWRTGAPLLPIREDAAV